MGLNVYGPLYRHVIYPVYHTLLGDGAVAATRELAAHDGLPAAALRQVERDKLRRLLEHAFSSVPYFAALAAELGLDAREATEAQGFGRLPELTKKIIRDHAAALTSRSLENNRLDANSTSGSSGEPLAFFTDLRSKDFRKAADARNRRWLGVRRGEPVLSLWGSAIDQRRAAGLRGRLHGLLTRERLLSAYSLSDADMERYAGIIRRYRPRLLVGYPSVLAEFARFCATRSLSFPSLTAIVCSAEALYQDQRETIESCFGVRVFNRYGCREVGAIAHETPASRGLVVNSDRILLEIVDADGEPCPPGVVGDFLVTDLDNYGMPLIRYRIGDRGCWSEAGQAAGGGLPYPVLDRVDGRSLDVVTTPGGRRVGGTFWTILFRLRPGMDRFQVVQTADDRVTVRYVAAQPLAAGAADFFRARIADTCGPDLDVAFERVDDIPPGPGGKFRLVVGRER
jgi:phenylacetate-CoA ligase